MRTSFRFNAAQQYSPVTQGLTRAVGSFLPQPDIQDIEQNEYNKALQGQLITEKIAEAANEQQRKAQFEPRLIEQGAAAADVTLPTFQAFRDYRQTGVIPQTVTPGSVTREGDTAGAITSRTVTPETTKPTYPEFNDPATRQRLTQALAQSLAALSATAPFHPSDISKYGENVATTEKIGAETAGLEQKNTIIGKALKAAQNGNPEMLRLLMATQGHDLLKPENEGGKFEWYGTDAKHKVLGFFDKHGKLVTTLGSPVDAHAEPISLSIPFPPMPATDASGKPILITPSKTPGAPPGVIPGVAPYQKPTLAEKLLEQASGGGGTLPPQAAAQLQNGKNTTFANGQVWTLGANGKPQRVK